MLSEVMLRLPRRKVVDRQFLQACCTLPMPAQLGHTPLAHAAICITRFPGCWSKVSFRLFFSTTMARLGELTPETHTEKAALPLAMFGWESRFGFPSFAHVTLKWATFAGVSVTALAAHAASIVALPLSYGICVRRFAFVAICTRAFLTIFCEESFPINGILSPQMPDKQVPSETNPLLKRTCFKRSKNEKVFSTLDAGHL